MRAMSTSVTLVDVSMMICPVPSTNPVGMMITVGSAPGPLLA